MTTPLKDRSDYRTMDTRDLIEEARREVHVDYRELAWALAERLHDHTRNEY
jgi:hypothetical protein